MKEFLRTYWLWIALPAVLVVAGFMAAVVLVGGPTNGDFMYTF